MGGRYGAVHGVDVPLIFHNPELWPLTAGSAESGVVADRMSAAFVAFAKNDAPGTPELSWQAYEPGSKPPMVFDVQSRVRNDPDRDLLSLLPQGREVAGCRGGVLFHPSRARTVTTDSGGSSTVRPCAAALAVWSLGTTWSGASNVLHAFKSAW
jgi:hypothetical protein